MRSLYVLVSSVLIFFITLVFRIVVFLFTRRDVKYIPTDPIEFEAVPTSIAFGRLSSSCHFSIGGLEFGLYFKGDSIVPTEEYFINFNCNENLAFLRMKSMDSICKILKKAKKNNDKVKFWGDIYVELLDDGTRKPIVQQIHQDRWGSSSMKDRVRVLVYKIAYKGKEYEVRSNAKNILQSIRLCEPQIRLL